MRTDVDNPRRHAFTPATIDGHRSVPLLSTLPATGTFTANSAFDNLNVGDNVNETFNVTSVDGTPSTVQIHHQRHQRRADSVLGDT